MFNQPSLQHCHQVGVQSARLSNKFLFNGGTQTAFCSRSAASCRSCSSYRDRSASTSPSSELATRRNTAISSSISRIADVEAVVESSSVTDELTAPPGDNE
jgi:hypothetical protein